MKLTRRDILRLGLGASALALAPIRLSAAGVDPKSIPIALQLYSIRDIAWHNLAKTFETVAGLGYTGVEFAGTFEKDAKTLKKLLDDAGLKCCGSHVGAGAFEGDNLKQAVEFYQELGNRFLVFSGVKAETTVEGWKKKAEWFNEKSALCQKDGMFLAYHNHQWEFKDYDFDGLTAWEVLFQNTDDAVTQELDTGHCAAAGFDPVKYIRMFPGRTRLVHMKEHGGGEIIGKGVVDWPAVITALAEVGGTQWFIVETEARSDTYEDVDACVKNLREMLG